MRRADWRVRDMGPDLIWTRWVVQKWVHHKWVDWFETYNEKEARDWVRERDTAVSHVTDKRQT